MLRVARCLFTEETHRRQDEEHRVHSRPRRVRLLMPSITMSSECFLRRYWVEIVPGLLKPLNVNPLYVHTPSIDFGATALAQCMTINRLYCIIVCCRQKQTLRTTPMSLGRGRRDIGLVIP